MPKLRKNTKRNCITNQRDKYYFFYEIYYNIYFILPIKINVQFSVIFSRNHHICCQEFCSVCCPRKPKTRVKIHNLSPSKRCPSPHKCKNNSPELCKCQKVNAFALSPKCCPPPLAPKACGCSCYPELQESYCPAKQKQEQSCEDKLKQARAIFCSSLAKHEQCCLNKQKQCSLPKCCCTCQFPKPCPKMKPCQKKCCNSSVRYNNII